MLGADTLRAEAGPGATVKAGLIDSGVHSKLVGWTRFVKSYTLASVGEVTPGPSP